MKTLFKSFLLATCILFSATAFAEPIAFTQAGFDGLQKEGKSILIAVHAPWCPTCRAQASVVNELIKKKEFQFVTVLRVDFDGQKEVLKAFNVSKQSTLIAFKGSNEVTRSTGDTAPASLEKLLQKAI